MAKFILSAFADEAGDSLSEQIAALKENGIYVRYWNKPRINNRLRITIGTDEQMDKMLAFLKDYLKERN